MNKFLTPGKMADRLEAKIELDRETTGRFTSELFEIIVRELQNDDSFSLFGFGSFKKVYVAPNKGRNPHTGEVIYVPAHYRIKFTPAGKLAQRINAEYAHLEPILLEQDEMIHEGLLLKAERYIMTAAAEPEPETIQGPVRNEVDDEARSITDTEIDQTGEKTVLSESEENADEELRETISPRPELEETHVEYIHQPDFGFKKDNRNKTLKLAILSILTLVLILGLGWMIFHKTEPATQIIVTEETIAEETQLVEAETVQEQRPEADVTAQDTATTVSEADLEEALPETNYSIESGDSFSLLAQKSWGNIYLWPYLYSRNSNSFPDPDLVKPGDSIVIPPQPDKEKDQIRIEDSILFAYQRYRNLISEQSENPKNPNRELSAGYVLMGGEKLYPSFLDRKQSEIRIEDIRRVENMDF